MSKTIMSLVLILLRKFHNNAFKVIFRKHIFKTLQADFLNYKALSYIACFSCLTNALHNEGLLYYKLNYLFFFSFFNVTM